MSPCPSRQCPLRISTERQGLNPAAAAYIHPHNRFMFTGRNGRGLNGVKWNEKELIMKHICILKRMIRLRHVVTFTFACLYLYGIYIFYFRPELDYRIIKGTLFRPYSIVYHSLEALEEKILNASFMTQYLPDPYRLDELVYHMKPRALERTGNFCATLPIYQYEYNNACVERYDSATLNGYDCPTLKRKIDNLIKTCHPYRWNIPARSSIIDRLSRPALLIARELPLHPMTTSEPVPKQIMKSIPGINRFCVLYTSRAGNDMLIAGISSQLDQVGEIPLFGIWVYFSHDGKTFRGPYHTGLRTFYPYHIDKKRRTIPYKNGAWLLPVRYRLLDDGHICFPPVCLDFFEREEAIIIGLPEEPLTRDSDGDGLTDLVEDRLVTDPFHPDTDGDGLTDAVDRNPLYPRSFKPPAKINIIDGIALQAWLKSDEILAENGRYVPIQPVIQTPDGFMKQKQLLQKRTFSYQTTFISGKLGMFRGIEPSQRIIVLTPFEAAMYQAKFGTTLFISFEDPIWDHKRKRALIKINGRWIGGTLEIVPEKGSWKVTFVSFYIT